MDAKTSGGGRSGPVLITGAGQGIGSAVARALAADGRGPLILVARHRENLETVAVACRNAGVEAAVYPGDVTGEDQMTELAAAVETRFGPLSVLINNAGQFSPASLLDLTTAAFDQQLDVNLRGAFLVTKAFLPGMVRRRAGLIVNVVSTDALRSRPGTLAYSVSKAGLLALTNGMREELRPHGIRVTAILPGATSTPSWEGSGVLEENLMPAEDVAAAVLSVLRMTARTAVEEIILRPPSGGPGA